MGQCFIYYTISEFSPLLLATVTTTRKIFSTLVSVFRDPSEMIYIYIYIYVYICNVI